MSIQNAITLITLRLGKIETFTQKLEYNNVLEKLQDVSSLNHSNETLNINNDEIINNIISKIDSLETVLNNFTSSNISNISNISKITNDINQIKLQLGGLEQNINEIKNENIEKNNNIEIIFDNLTKLSNDFYEMNTIPNDNEENQLPDLGVEEHKEKTPQEQHIYQDGLTINIDNGETIAVSF
jgi:hypothetical protein